MPKVAVASLMHESNSFNPAFTPLEAFDFRGCWTEGETEVAGFVEQGTADGLTVVPGFHATATPGGVVEERAYESLVDCLLKSIGSVDAVYLALHGAMVAEHAPHADEETLRRVRRQIGDDVPLVVTFDFHANISPETVRLCTALVGYQQNPHLDTRQRGARAASILARTLRGEVRPVQAISKPPMIWNIVHQNTYAEPLLSVVRDSQELEGRPGVLAASVAGGYQYADVPHVGPSVVVVTDGETELARTEAQRLSDRLWDAREDLTLDLPDPALAVREAIRSEHFPVALFDTGDNVLGGAPGDSTAILSELLRQGTPSWVFVIADPDGVQAAVRDGLDGSFDRNVGNPPVRIRGRVRSLHAGRYLEPEVRHGGGRHHDLGHSAVVEVGDSMLLLTTLRSHPNSIHQLVSCGIYPERHHILVAKGAIAPRAAYGSVAKRIVLVDSPGATAVNPARFQYKHIRPGLFGI